jgi:CrcB protein
MPIIVARVRSAPAVKWEIDMHVVWIAVGSALGGAGRYLFQGAAQRLMGATFPWGTLGVNVVGSAFIGFFAAATAPDGRWLVGSGARQFVMIGLCGGFTTFSSFSLETLNLAREGDLLRAGANAAASFCCCLAAVWGGHALAMALNR